MTRLVTHKTLAARLGVGVLAMGLVSLLVLTGSRAAFTDSTDNPGNTWEAGQVTLTDDHNGTAMFTTTDMVPGTSVQNCITVTYEGTDSGTPQVTLYGADGAATVLNPDLDLTIEHVAGDLLNSTCEAMTTQSTLFQNTVADFTGTKTNFASGVDTWAPASGESRIYRFTVVLGSDTADAQQGAQGSAGFTWEVQVSE